jgi:hypothetical protein
MTSTRHLVPPDPPGDWWSNELRSLGLGQKNDWPSRPPAGKRSSRRLTRFLITFCIGVAATLAWQSFGDEARRIAADSSPVLGWLAPQAAPLAQVASDQPTATEPATPSPDLRRLRAALLDLAAVRQSVEQLAAQNQQMAGDIATMQAAQQVILRKVSPPPPPAPRQAAPAHNAVQN